MFIACMMKLLVWIQWNKIAMDSEKNIANNSVLYPEFWQKAPLFNHVS